MGECSPGSEVRRNRAIGLVDGNLWCYKKAESSEGQKECFAFPWEMEPLDSTYSTYNTVCLDLTQLALIAH